MYVVFPLHSHTSAAPVFECSIITTKYIYVYVYLQFIRKCCEKKKPNVKIEKTNQNIRGTK